jgi:DNA repair photolyase
MFPGVKEKYSGVARTNAKWLNEIKQFTDKDFVFVCDMTDLFGHWVPTEIIQQIFIAISSSPAKFLLLTKNPERYRQLISIGVAIPQNCVLGCTVESDVDHLSSGMQERARLMVMMELRLMGYPIMLSVEPIMAFTNRFLKMILDVKPMLMAVGYDNYSNGLVEPPLAETLAFIAWAEASGITVYRKTLRRGNQEIQYCEKEGQDKL